MGVPDDDTHPRVHLLEAFAVLWVRQSIDNGIVDGRGLRHENGQLGDERSDQRRVTPGAEHANDREGSPREDPEGDVHQGDFRCLDLGGRLELVAVGPQRGHVHLSRLLSELVLVHEHRSDYESVAEDYDDDREGKLGDACR